jgi:enoyl-CoA hydratase/carnithine racemase
MSEIEVHYDFFSTRFLHGVLIIDFKKNLLIQGTRLKNRDIFFSYLDSVASCDPVKVIIFRSYLEESGHREYMEFFQSIKSGKSDLDLHRLCNMYSSLILKITGFNKIVIHATSGNVISLFLNMSLACDYRVAADNTVFLNSFLDAGILPIGGGPFFLSKKIGSGKAYELLALKKKYDANEAIQYGLIDRIVPFADLEAETLNIAGQFQKVPAQTLKGLKRLINYSVKDLQNYLEFEYQEIFKIVHNQAFRHS